jgi:ATP-dependent DNA helicase RecQ
MATKELAQRLDVSTRRMTGAVNLLEQAGAVRVQRGRVRAEEVTPTRAVRLARELADSRERVLRSRMDMMRAYAETTGCRRRFLLGYLGEDLDERCGHCDTCDDGTAAASDAARPPADVEDPFPVGREVDHREWGAGLVMSTEPDRLTILFESEGYRTLSLEAVQEEDLLSLR